MEETKKKFSHKQTFGNDARRTKPQGLNGRVKVRQHDARIVKGVLLLMKEETRHIGEGRGK